MATLGAGDNAQPFATVKDYKAWLNRLDGYVVWIDQAIVNMREGITRGVVQPRVVIEKVLPQLDAMITADPTQNVYFGPIAHFPDGISATDRDWLTAQYRAAIGDKLVPAFERLRAFVRDEYLPHGRETVAWTALPDGEAWYAFAAEGHTTVHMTADEIHQLGLSEVARILGEMDEVRRQVGFEGDRQAFFKYLETDPQFYFTRGEDLVAGYVALKHRIDGLLPKLFAVFPKSDYEVREVEPYRAASSAGGFYQPPSADGSRPGIFYVNTYNLKAQPKFGMETLSLHEAAPGHHFQIALQQEMQDLPRFRRFGGDYTAYVEGWALYAESLGKELGLFTDPYQWFGPPERRAAARDASRRRHRPARQGLDARAGDSLHARQLDARRVRRRLGSRALHRLARSGARLQDRRPAHPGPASRGRTRTRRTLRRARFPPRGAQRRRGPDGRARAQDRALDRRASLTRLVAC
jgi:uncharacterized protein (DUF885 family)